MQNVARKTFFLHFVYSNQEKMNKQNKTVVKIHFKVFYLPVEHETANHVNFMPALLISYSLCYFSSLEGDIQKYKNINLW